VFVSSRWTLLRRTLRSLLLSCLLMAVLLVTMVATAACTGDGGEDGDTTTSVSTAITVPGGNDGNGGAPGAITKIGIIAPEKGNDFGWNQQGVESARALAAELGAEIEVSDGAGYEDIPPIFRQLAANGADWILLWAGGYNIVGPQLAQETGVKTLVIDAREQGLIPGLSADAETEAQQGAYLAGVVAAKMSKTGTVGVVVSADDLNWNKMSGGFIAGAQAARPDIDIKLAQAGQAAYADPAAGKRVTDAVIAAGADIVFGMGDGSTFGMIQSVETATPPQGADKVWFIDVIGDKSSIDEKSVLLTSVVWDYLPVLREAAVDIEAGTYGERIHSIDLENGGISLLESEHIPAEVWTEVEAAREGIIAGTIAVPVIDNKAGVEALLD
jgi:basic membrane protein A